MITGIPRQQPRRIGRPALDAALSTAHQTTVVRAPSGFGKTTLVTGWSRRTPLPGVWISVPKSFADDGELPALLDRVSGAAVEAAAAGSAEPDAEDGRQRAGFVLVIDGADRLGERDSDRVEALRATVTGLRVVLVSQTRSILELRAVEAAPDRVHVIDQSDLELSPRETQALLAADSVVAPLPVAAALCAAAAGSVRLLRMTAEELGAGTVLRTADLDSQPLRGAVAAVARRVIATEDSSVVTFILRTVLADDLTPALIRALCEGPGQLALVRALVAKGLGSYGGIGLNAGPTDDAAAIEFTATADELVSIAAAADRAVEIVVAGSGTEHRLVALPDRRRSGSQTRARFRYFPLVAAGMRSVLAGRDAGLVRSIRQRIVKWARDENEYPTLFTQYVLGGDLERASRLALSQWREILFGAGPDAALAIQTVPRTTIVQHPPLLILLALITASHVENADRNLDYLTVVATGSDVYGSHLAPEWRAVFATMQSTALLMIGKNDASAKKALSVVASLKKLSPAQLVAIREQLPTLKNVLATTLFHCGDDSAALILLDEAIADSVALRVDDTTVGLQPVALNGTDLTAVTVAGTYLHNLALLAWIRANRGEIGEAITILERIDSTDWPDGVLSSPCAVVAHLARTLVAVEAQDWEAAGVAIVEARNHVASDELWGPVDALDALIALGVGDPQRARSLMEAAARRGRTDVTISPLMTEWIDAIRLVTGLATGSQIAQSLTPPTKSAPGLERARRVSAARLALTMGDPDLADRLVDPVLSSLEATPRQLCDSLLISAAAQLRKNAAAPSARTVSTVSDRSAGSRANRARDSAAATQSGAQDAESRGGGEKRAQRSRNTRIAWLLGRAAGLIQEHRISTSIVLLAPPDLAAIVSSAATHSDPLVRDHLGSTAWLSLLRSEQVARGMLTARERVVLSELTVSTSVVEIASTLFVSPNTVKSQLRSLYKKLGVGTRGEALEVACRLGLIDSGDRQRRG